MAYAALVRSASSFGYAQAEHDVQADSMAWFCVEVLLDAIRHALREGTYPLVPTKLADAMIAANFILIEGTRD